MELNHKRFEKFYVQGFRGFLPVSTLESTNYLESVPYQPGVYLVLNPTLENPKWLRKSVGGHIRDEDPTVPLSDLKEQWVDGADILYVGHTPERTLYERIPELIEFGSGESSAHWGGRLIWQLDNHSDLLICWLVHENPVEMRKKILRRFKSKYNVLPFANLRS